MGDSDIEGGGGGEDDFRSPIGRKYRPVLANDRAVLEMSSMDPGSSSTSSSSAFPDPPPNLRKINVSTSANGSSDVKEEGDSPHHPQPNGPQQESKLELFGFDSLVNILGLKSMAGEQVAPPSSPRDGEDITITAGLPKPATPKLGTMMGVFIPCVQSILGIIYYIRFSWIVGMAGIGETLLLVAMCGTCTFLTSISLSAIATNGAMKGGGPYYLIGRALGPEVGVSIGLCFFLGNAVAGALYVLGAVETFLKAVPSAGIFRETITQVNGTAIAQPIESPSSHDLQIYGIVVTILLCFIVFGGVKMINRVAPAFLIPVVFSLICIYLGVLLARKDHPTEGVTGLSVETIRENWSSDYQKTNDAGIPETDGSVSWNFNSLVGLFFPAVTGIMAGSNRSSSLRDTQRSIPVGTLAATLSTTTMYLISVILFGAVATREKLLTDRLLTATVAWPFPSLIKIGIILSTMGAALQSLTGAPRLLAAIANDDILPILNYFKVADGSEPHVATLFTAFLCIGCVIIGNLDLITPTVTMFFLLCYAGVNLSCFLLDLLDAPSWRPRWKFHHWSLSLVGALLCIVIMFLISWSFTVVSLALASLIYKYVSIKGKAGDWGDGFKSAYFQLALRSLRSLGDMARTRGSTRQRPTASVRRERAGRSEPFEDADIEDPQHIEEVEAHIVAEEEPLKPPFPGGPEDTSILRSYDDHVAKILWLGQDRAALKCIAQGRKFKDVPMNDQIRTFVENSGLLPLLTCSHQHTNKGLCSALAERWHKETSTFHLPVGEMTITLDDVSQLLHIPITGSFFRVTIMSRDDAVATLVDLLGVSYQDAFHETEKHGCARVRLSWLEQVYHEQCMQQHWTNAARALLLRLVCSTIFTNKSAMAADVAFLELFRDMEAIGGYAWGAGALAFLYDQLNAASLAGCKQLAGYLTLLQGWIFEHLPDIGCQSLNLDYNEDEPRASRWTPGKAPGQVGGYRRALDEMPMEDVVWTPYTVHRETRPFQQIGMFSGYIRWGSLAVPHLPERVLRQYGFIQGIPRSPRVLTGVHTTIEEMHASWVQFDQHLFIRFVTVDVATRIGQCIDGYMEWYSRISHPFIIPAIADIRRYFEPVSPSTVWRYFEPERGRDSITRVCDTEIMSARRVRH